MDTTTPPEVKMAIGRLFAMMMRPAQEGDLEMFEKIRAVVMEHSNVKEDYVPNYARDWNRGAQGDLP